MSNIASLNQTQMQSFGSLTDLLDGFVPVINETSGAASTSLQDVKDSHGTDTVKLAIMQKDWNDSVMAQTILSSTMKKGFDLAQTISSNSR